METSKKQWLREWMGDLDKLMVEAIGLHFWDVHGDDWWRELYHQKLTPEQAVYRATGGIRAGDRYGCHEHFGLWSYTEMLVIRWDKPGFLLLHRIDPNTGDIGARFHARKYEFKLWNLEKIEDTNNAQEVTT